ncbi:MAG: hypothetical protein NE334_19155 [Lentisphaeraceae bacterium]|nr:hypothetical protein [Lentisphaeraceae bacterium]
MKEDTLNISSKTFGILFIILNIYLLSIILRLNSWITKQKYLVSNLLDGEPIPHFNEFLYSTYQYYYILPVISLSLSIAVITSKANKNLYALLAVITTFAFTFWLIGIKQESIFAPNTHLLKQLSQ